MGQAARRLAAFFLIPALLQLTTGCTLVGLSLGASAPRTRTVIAEDAPYDGSARIPIRERCSVQTRREGSFDGDVDSIAGSDLRMSSGTSLVVVPIRDVRTMSCREGNYADVGFGVGLAIDVAAITVGLFAVVRSTQDARAAR